MSKYLSTDAFLAGATARAIDHNIPGLGTVKVRGLETLELEQIDAGVGDGGNMRWAILAVATALVEPKITPGQAEHMIPGVVKELSEVIAQLSGLSGDAEKNDSPPGDGSSSATPTAEQT